MRRKKTRGIPIEHSIFVRICVAQFILICLVFFCYLFIAPPSNIEIQGYGANSKVEVRQNEDLTLTCIVSDAKPAAQIQWLRNNVEMKTGNSVLFR